MIKVTLNPAEIADLLSLLDRYPLGPWRTKELWRVADRDELAALAGFVREIVRRGQAGSKKSERLTFAAPEAADEADSGILRINVVLQPGQNILSAHASHPLWAVIAEPIRNPQPTPLQLLLFDKIRTAWMTSHGSTGAIITSTGEGRDHFRPGSQFRQKRPSWRNFARTRKWRILNPIQRVEPGNALSGRRTSNGQTCLDLGPRIGVESVITGTPPISRGCNSVPRSQTRAAGFGGPLPATRVRFLLLRLTPLRPRPIIFGSS